MMRVLWRRSLTEFSALLNLPDLVGERGRVLLKLCADFWRCRLSAELVRKKEVPFPAAKDVMLSLN